MPLAPAPDPRAIPLHLRRPERARGLAGAARMPPTRGVGRRDGLRRRRSARLLCLPAPDGSLRAALVGWGTPEARRRDRFPLAAAAAKLPAGTYALGPRRRGLDPGLEALGWLLADYRFDRYREGKAAAGRAGLPGRRRRRAARTDRRGGGAGADADRHPGARHGARGARGRLRRARRAGTAPRRR